MATTYTVTVQSTGEGNKFFIDGVQQDSLTLEAGQTYIFDQSDASNSGHPLALSRTNNGTHAGGVEYTNGITATGTAGTDRVLTFTAPNNAPSALYYYCQVHSGMGGYITVQNQTDNDPIRNFFKTLIVGEYSTTDTQLDVISTDAPQLPDPAVEGAYNLTIFRGTDSSISEFFEIVRVTAKSSNTLTVVRAQEGSTALDMQDPNHVFGVVYSATKKTFDDIKAEIDQAQLDIAKNATDISNIEFADQDLNTTDGVTFDSVITTSRFRLPSISSFPTNAQIGELFINSSTNELVVFNGLHFQRVFGDVVAQLQKANATASIIELDLGLEVVQPGATAFANEINAIALSQAERLLEIANSNAGVLDSILQFKPVEIQFLIQAGGGGGGSTSDGDRAGGGGGGGGLISSVIGERSGQDSDPVSTFFAVPQTDYNVVVGAGGREGGANGGYASLNGNDSSIFGLTAIGGGRGAVRPLHNGGSGGCGGGGASGSFTSPGAGTANQGFNGAGPNSPYGGGGGGTGGAGGSSWNPGVGTSSAITGTSIGRGGGGWGGIDFSASKAGVDGGGGLTPGGGGVRGLPGDAHKGGGGGAGGDDSIPLDRGGAGGSGIVILLYPDTASLTLSNGATSLNGENIDRGDGFRYTEIITTGTVTF